MTADTDLVCWCGRLLRIVLSVTPHRYVCACGHNSITPPA